MKAVLRRTRISPKKANLIAGTVRNKKVDEALALLKFMPKKGARILYDVLHSAFSNAKNNFKQNSDDLVIESIIVTKGPTLKRSVPISRGRAHPIRKRSCNITVQLSVNGVTEIAKPTKEVKSSKAKVVSEKVESKEEKPKKTVSKAAKPKATKVAKESKK